MKDGLGRETQVSIDRPKKPRKAITPWDYAKPGCSEHAEQVALFMWAGMASRFGIEIANTPNMYDEGRALQTFEEISTGAYRHASNYQPLAQLALMFAIPNGGLRDPITAGKLKAEGVKRGVADVFLPVPRHATGSRAIIEYCGLFVEMKKREYKTRKDGGRSIEQLAFQMAMGQQGYVCEPAYGWEEARNLVLGYLGY